MSALVSPRGLASPSRSARFSNACGGRGCTAQPHRSHPKKLRGHPAGGGAGITHLVVLHLHVIHVQVQADRGPHGRRRHGKHGAGGGGRTGRSLRAPTSAPVSRGGGKDTESAQPHAPHGPPVLTGNRAGSPGSTGGAAEGAAGGAAPAAAGTAGCSAAGASCGGMAAGRKVGGELRAMQHGPPPSTPPRPPSPSQDLPRRRAALGAAGRGGGNAAARRGRAWGRGGRGGT